MDIGAEGTEGQTIAIAEACEGIEAAALSIHSAISALSARTIA